MSDGVFLVGGDSGDFTLRRRKTVRSEGLVVVDVGLNEGELFVGAAGISKVVLARLSNKLSAGSVVEIRSLVESNHSGSSSEKDNSEETQDEEFVHFLLLR